MGISAELVLNPSWMEVAGIQQVTIRGVFVGNLENGGDWWWTSDTDGVLEHGHPTKADALQYLWDGYHAGYTVHWRVVL